MLAGWYQKGGRRRNVIEVGDMETPRTGPGEVLVRLHASGINPSDYKNALPARRSNFRASFRIPTARALSRRSART